MDLGLKGKRALVLAGTSGLGRGTAQALANDGVHLVINGRQQQRTQQVAAEIEAEAGTAQAVHAAVGDVTSAHDLQQVFAAATGKLGGLDLLVINAGGPTAGGFEDLTDDDWAAGFELTMMSVVRSVRLALPYFRQAGSGSVVAIGSSSIRQAVQGLTLSNSIRPGVNALIRELATTLGPEGIRFNMVSPGRIVTPRLDSLDEKRAALEGTTVEAVRSNTALGIPLRRLGNASEFGSVAAFLLSDAASYLTGQSLLVDGGMVTAI